MVVTPVTGRCEGPELVFVMATEDSGPYVPALARGILFPNVPFWKRENLNVPCLVERKVQGAAIMRPRAKGLAIHRQVGRRQCILT